MGKFYFLFFLMRFFVFNERCKILWFIEFYILFKCDFVFLNISLMFVLGNLKGMYIFGNKIFGFEFIK